MRFPLVVVALLAAVRVAAADPSPADAPAAPADAPPSEALTRARAAEARARAGDYAGAIVLFKQAFALEGRAEYACNVGVAYYKARDLPRAQLFLDACLLSGADLPRDFVASVWRVLETVEGRLRQGDYAPIDLRVAPGAAEVRVSIFADDEPVVGSRRIWLPVGRHEIAAVAPGYTGRQFTVEVGSRQAQRIDVVLPLEAPPPRSQADSKPIAEPAVAPPPVVVTPRAAVTPPDWAARPLYTPAARNAHHRTVKQIRAERELRAAQLRATDDVPTTDVRTAEPVPTTEQLRAPSNTGAKVTTAVSLGLFAASLLLYSEGSSDDPFDPGAAFARNLSYVGFTGSAVTGIVSLALWSRSVGSGPSTPTVSASASGNGGAVWLGGRF